MRNSNHKYEKWWTINGKFPWIIHKTLIIRSNCPRSVQEEFNEFSEFIDRFKVGKRYWLGYLIVDDSVVFLQQKY